MHDKEKIEEVIALKLGQLCVKGEPDNLGITKAMVIAEAVMRVLPKPETMGREIDYKKLGDILGEQFIDSDDIAEWLKINEDRWLLNKLPISKGECSECKGTGITHNKKLCDCKEGRRIANIAYKSPEELKNMTTGKGEGEDNSLLCKLRGNIIEKQAEELAKMREISSELLSLCDLEDEHSRLVIKTSAKERLRKLLK